MRTAQLFLADIARALEGLKPADAATQKAIARAIGFRLRQDEARREHHPPPLSFAVPPSTTAKGPDPQAFHRSTRSERLEPEELPSRAKWLEAERDDSIQQELPVEIRSADLLESEEAELAATAPIEPLFVPRGVRGILVGSLSVRSEGDEIDIEMLIDTIAYCGMVRELPRQLRPRTPSQLHVLVDRRDGMLPFYRDEDSVVEELCGVMGQEQIRLHYFFTSPVDVFGVNAGVDRLDFAHVAAGTPVLLLSDLGIGRVPFSADAVDLADWRALTRRAWRARCPVVAFNPYPRHRWPRRLVNALSIVPWDRFTTAGAVRGEIGSGLVSPR